jgi:hypothetical protein
MVFLGEMSKRQQPFKSVNGGARPPTRADGFLRVGRFLLEYRQVTTNQIYFILPEPISRHASFD